MACLSSSFLSNLEKKHPDPKSDQDVAPDKGACVTSCRGGVSNPNFLPAFFLDFGPRFPTFQTIAGVIESVVGSAAVETSHYDTKQYVLVGIYHIYITEACAYIYINIIAVLFCNQCSHIYLHWVPFWAYLFVCCLCLL